MEKGVYRLIIQGKSYVGQDSSLWASRRYNTHLSDLRNNKHFNPELQADFNRFGEEHIEYEVLARSSLFTKDNLNTLEKHFIEVYKSFSREFGYNKTLGGIGMTGYKYGADALQKRSEAVSGEKNPGAKLTNVQFFEIVEMFKQDKTNDEIAVKYGLHDRYVSLIRHKRRFASLWATVGDYTAPKSGGQTQNRMINYEKFVDIALMLEDGATNAGIERKHRLSGGTGSRIRHRKLYRDLWERFDLDHANGTFNDYRKQA